MSLLNYQNRTAKFLQHDVLVAIGKRIRAEREAAGISAGDLCSRVGCTINTLYRTENGAQMSIAYVYSIACALGRPVAAFFPEVT